MDGKFNSVIPELEGLFALLAHYASLTYEICLLWRYGAPKTSTLISLSDMKISKSRVSSIRDKDRRL